MARPFGLSFVPGQPKEAGSPSGGGPLGQSSPVQQAIQMLSLRLPRVLGAQGLAPSALMQAPGGAGLGAPPQLEQILQALFGFGLRSPSLAPSGLVGGQAPPMRPSAPPPLPRIEAGVRGPAIPGQRPGVPPLPNSGGWPPASPTLPTPAYTPVPGRPRGYGNAPDNWRPFGSGPAGYAGPGRPF